MRLRPPVTKEETLEWLRQEAIRRWGALTPELEQSLDSLAEAMVAISALELAPEFEPLLA
jgi:hypothetical protein